MTDSLSDEPRTLDMPHFPSLRSIVEPPPPGEGVAPSTARANVIDRLLHAR